MEIQRLTRRQILRVTGGVALSAVPGLGLMQSASAGRAWCYRDPLFSIDGYYFDMVLGADARMPSSANGPVLVTLHIPKGSNAELIFQDSGFGYGYTYSIVDDLRNETPSKLLVGVDIVAPAADSSLPILLWIASLSKDAASITQKEVKGFANATMSWRGTITKKADQTDAKTMLLGQ